MKLIKNDSATNRCCILLVAVVAITIAAGSMAALAEEPQGWHGSAALGFTATSGNTETILLNASGLARRLWPKNELSLGADFNYGRQKVVDGSRQTTAESERGYVDYKRLFNERLYGGARIEILHDAIADVEYRLTLAGFIGYYFIKDDTTRLSGEVGPAYVFEKLGSDSNNYITLRLGERFEHTFNKSVKVWQSLEFLPNLQDIDKYLANFEVGVETALTTKLGLRVVAQDKYDSQPTVGRKKNDLSLITALVYKF